MEEKLREDLYKELDKIHYKELKGIIGLVIKRKDDIKYYNTLVDNVGLQYGFNMSATGYEEFKKARSISKFDNNQALKIAYCNWMESTYGVTFDINDCTIYNCTKEDIAVMVKIWDYKYL